MKKYSVKKWQKLASSFCQLRSKADLARLLKIEVFKLDILAKEPLYYVFTVPLAYL
ncbi:MAG: hypothetical protein AAFP19_17385 [Bacteroidota bacterium]